MTTKKSFTLLILACIFMSLYSFAFVASPQLAMAAASPKITSTPVTSATQDQLYTYNVVATDPDAGDTLTYLLDLFPIGMAIDSSTGEIRWTPSSDQVGDNSVTVRVKDTSALFATQDFTITVLDTTPPTTPVVTDDGEYTLNTTQLHATWSSSDSESGIVEYEYAIGTSPQVTDVVAWTSVGTDTEVTHPLNLTIGTTYYFAVRAMNGDWTWSRVGVSDGIIVADATAPTTPVVYTEPTTSHTDISAIWTSYDDESGIAEYQYALGTSPGGTDILGWISTNTTPWIARTDLHLTAEKIYYVTVKARNGYGLWSEAGISDPITAVDYLPPTTPVVIDDGSITMSLYYLHASWSSSDPESGIVEYEYAIGTSLRGTEVLNWTSAGKDTGVTYPLNLVLGTTYYFAVKAKNGNELWSAIGSSDGITADATPAPLVIDDGDLASSTTELHAIWNYPSSEFTIDEYWYAIGTSLGTQDVVGWTLVDTSTEVHSAHLNLTVGDTYYFAVCAKTTEGQWSRIGTSDGITIDGVTASASTSSNIPTLLLWFSVGAAGAIAPLATVLIGRQRGYLHFKRHTSEGKETTNDLET